MFQQQPVTLHPLESWLWAHSKWRWQGQMQCTRDNIAPCVPGLFHPLGPIRLLSKHAVKHHALLLDSKLFLWVMYLIQFELGKREGNTQNTRQKPSTVMSVRKEEHRWPLPGVNVNLMWTRCQCGLSMTDAYLPEAGCQGLVWRDREPRVGNWPWDLILTGDDSVIFRTKSVTFYGIQFAIFKTRWLHQIRLAWKAIGRAHRLWFCPSQPVTDLIYLILQNVCTSLII